LCFVFRRYLLVWYHTEGFNVPLDTLQATSPYPITCLVPAKSNINTTKRQHDKT